MNFNTPNNHTFKSARISIAETHNHKKQRVKTGRNDPCPCGSGKKYKKCCGAAISNASLQKKQPTNTQAMMMTAWQHFQAGRLQNASRIYHVVLDAEPNNADALNLLSGIASQQNNLNQAIELIQRALVIQPLRPELHNNLGYLYNELRNPEAAIDSLTRAIELNPDYADAYLNKAIALKTLGKITAAISDCRRSLAIKPDNLLAQTNLLYFLNCSEQYSPKEIFEEHASFGRQYQKRIRQLEPVQDRRTERKIHIGYVSPDLRTHSVSYFIEPVLENHNHNKFRVFAYYNSNRSDATTQRLRSYCDEWRMTTTLNDRQFADQVRRDNIDILVDLAGYTANSRILAFAHKPAPVQITWLGYPNTTGLPALDFRITDSVADPADNGDQFYTENQLRIKGCFLCYKPPKVSPTPAPSPFLKNKYITFGSFNNLAKVSDIVISVWARILQLVPDARLILKCAGLSGEKRKMEIQRQFSNLGITRNRVSLLGNDPSQQEHLIRYSEIDIALDTFPYNGTTTTCEALWMGVPVITFSGDSHRSRVGTSLLQTLGLDELIGKDRNDYVTIATQLAGDYDRLDSLRTNLRRRLSSSPLTDASMFTKRLETLYENIIRNQ